MIFAQLCGKWLKIKLLTRLCLFLRKRNTKKSSNCFVIFDASVWICRREGVRPWLIGGGGKERAPQSRSTGHPVWSLFEMTWPPPLSDRIDFLYLILFLHLLWPCPLRYVHTRATGLSLTSTSPKSALGNLCTAAHNTVRHYTVSQSLCSVQFFCLIQTETQFTGMIKKVNAGAVNIETGLYMKSIKVS